MFTDDIKRTPMERFTLLRDGQGSHGSFRQVDRFEMASASHARGYKVLEAANGLDALSVAEKFQGEIHMVVTDVIIHQ